MSMATAACKHTVSIAPLISSLDILQAASDVHFMPVLHCHADNATAECLCLLASLFSICTTARDLTSATKHLGSPV